MDIVYLDFAILMEKIAKNKIKGKQGKWIREFLRDRKCKVMANRDINGAR